MRLLEVVGYGLYRIGQLQASNPMTTTSDVLKSYSIPDIISWRQ